MGRYEILLARVEQEIPGVQVILHKDSRFMSVIHTVLKVLTFGKFDPNMFTSTIGKRMYVPNDWYKRGDQDRYHTLRHELVHMRQFRRWPFKFLDKKPFRVVNFALFSFCYLFVLPVLFTMRAKFEREAYTQSILVHYEILGSYPSDLARRLEDNLANHFSGPSYFFMWREKAARRWVRNTMEKVTIGEIRNDKDRVNLE